MIELCDRDGLKPIMASVHYQALVLLFINFFEIETNFGFGTQAALGTSLLILIPEATNKLNWVAEEIQAGLSIDVVISGQLKIIYF